MTVAPFDREGALKRAEKALRLGKVDAAIEEYQALVLAQPRDWNSANALGDLFVRAGQLDKGVEQYTRIADHLADEGFYPKAAALFGTTLTPRPPRTPSSSRGPVGTAGSPTPWPSPWRASTRYSIHLCCQSLSVCSR